MRKLKRTGLPLAVCALVAASLTACSSGNNANTTATTNVAPPAATPSPSPQSLTTTPRPQKIEAAMKDRGEQDQAKPVLRIASPTKGQVINGSTVNVKLDLSGDLKGYKPHKDPATQKGNHIHVILDNEPYEAYYELGQPFELRNVTEGKHTLRVFASRPWHESYKNEGSFQMVAFSVKGGGDASKPTTTNGGQVMANNNANANAAAPREGKDVGKSEAGDIDPQKPLLTYSRPKGENKGEDADPIMIDFWLSNGKLQGDGGQYRVRYTVDGGAPRHIEKWEPIWLTGWTSGKHTVKLELVDKNDTPIENGGYNTTTREITVAR